MKKLFCLLLAVCLLAPLLPMGARAAAEDLTPYVKVLEDAMKTDADAERYGEAMFFDLDASAPRELILVRCPEDAAHAVLEVWTIRSGEAVRILHTPLVVLAGGNTGVVHVGEYNGKPILVAESRSPEAGENTVTVMGGFKRFVMENGRVVQQVTHEELLKEDGLYSTLVRQQEILEKRGERKVFADGYEE